MVAAGHRLKNTTAPLVVRTVLLLSFPKKEDMMCALHLQLSDSVGQSTSCLTPSLAAHARRRICFFVVSLLKVSHKSPKKLDTTPDKVVELIQYRRRGAASGPDLTDAISTA